MTQVPTITLFILLLIGLLRILVPVLIFWFAVILLQKPLYEFWCLVRGKFKHK